MTDDDHEPDAAAEAFARLEGELALMRRAVERLAIERGEVPESPDYSETLAQITKLANATYQRAELLRKAAEEETVACQVAARIAGAVAEDRQAVKAAAGELRDATRVLQNVTGSARRADEQKRWTVLAALGGIGAGMILWAVVAGPVARALPTSWQIPEGMAANTLGMSMWDAGRHLAASSSPDNWNTMVRGAIIVQDNRKALDACRKRANKVHEAVRCPVSVEADPAPVRENGQR